MGYYYGYYPNQNTGNYSIYCSGQISIDHLPSEMQKQYEHLNNMNSMNQFPGGYYPFTWGSYPGFIPGNPNNNTNVNINSNTNININTMNTNATTNILPTSAPDPQTTPSPSTPLPHLGNNTSPPPNPEPTDVPSRNTGTFSYTSGFVLPKASSIENINNVSSISNATPITHSVSAPATSEADKDTEKTSTSTTDTMKKRGTVRKRPVSKVSPSSHGSVRKTTRGEKKSSVVAPSGPPKLENYVC
jgi:hypothetical protein